MKTEKNNLEEESMPSVEPVHTKDEEKESEEKKEVMISVRTLRIIAAVIVVLLLAYFTRGLFVAAVVNGSPISRVAVIHQLEKSGGKAALENLITQKLIADAAKKQGISVSASEIDVEVKKIEAQVASAGQGATLDTLLAQRGMTRDDLTAQITVQKQVEKLLGDKVEVADSDVDKYITDNKITLPKGEEAADRVQIKEQIRQQKLSQEGQAYIDSLHTGAKVSYFVQY